MSETKPAKADVPVQFPVPAQLNIADEFITRPAREHPERIAIVGEPLRFTYREMQEAVARTANWLCEQNCNPGDRVLIVLPDSLEFIAAFFGAAKIGAIAVPVNSMARAKDYAYYLEDTGARIAIVHASAMEEFARVEKAANLRVLAMCCTETVESEGERAFEVAARAFPDVALVDWDREWSTASPTAHTHATAATDPAFILYTSGSGGTPKGAIHLHRDMVQTTRGYAQGVLGLRADDITYSVSKLFFAYGLGNGMYFPFAAGARTVLDPGKPKPQRTAELLKRCQPTILFSVPTFFAALVREAERGLAIDCSSLRCAVSAGEPLPAEIFERFKNIFGVEILDGIGSTEMLHMFVSARPGEARGASCGREVPGCAAQIVDENGARAPDGEIGNLWVRGGGAFAGYWNKPELTARTKRGDWVITGDKFTRSADGFFHYCGRADDMMKVAGMWVSPGEVENALLGHPSIAEAAVVARENENGLVHPAAYIVLKLEAKDGDGNELAQEIRNWLRKKMVSYKCPHEIFFVEALPKTATGKIQRFLLRNASGA